MLPHQVLHQLLQLRAPQLEQRFRDGEAESDALGVADAMDGQGHSVLAPEDVSAAAVAGDGGDPAAVEGHRHSVRGGGSGGGGVDQSLGVVAGRDADFPAEVKA